MSTCWFPDITVLCNFAAVGRLLLLEKVLDGRGRWTQAVAYEARQSAAYHPGLRAVTDGGWLGEPIEITDHAWVPVTAPPDGIAVPAGLDPRTPGSVPVAAGRI